MFKKTLDFMFNTAQPEKFNIYILVISIENMSLSEEQLSPRL